MSSIPPAFKSPKGETEFMAAYGASLQLWPVPYEVMDIPGRFGRTHLVACGPKDAPALVLLHMDFSSLTMWAYNIADLSRDYRVYAVDVMGQPGKSIPVQPIRNREDFVAWLTSILDTLKIDRASLVGVSYGGWLTLNYALGAPMRVEKIVVLSPAGGFLPVDRQYFLRALPIMFFPRRFLVEGFIRWMTFKENLGDPKNQLIYDRVIDQMYLGIRYFRPQMRVFPFAFTDEELRAMQVPTLLLIGQEEVIYDPAAALARARELVPNFEGDLIPRASHEMTFSQHESVDARILSFLKDKHA